MKTSLFSTKAATLAAIAVILLLWQLAAVLLDSAQLLPTPVDTFRILADMLVQRTFWMAVGQTVIRGLLGFLLAALASALIGIPSGLYPLANAFFSPFLAIIRSTPVISVILLALIWFRVEQVPVFIGFLTMFPILTTNLTQGIQALDKTYVSLAKVYRIRFWDTLTGIYLPGVSPFIFSALVTATGFGWRAIIIGEVLSQPRYGIGSLMQQAQSYLLVGEVIGWTVVAVAISYFFEKMIRLAQIKVTKGVQHD